MKFFEISRFFNVLNELNINLYKFKKVLLKKLLNMPCEYSIAFLFEWENSSFLCISSLILFYPFPFLFHLLFLCLIEKKEYTSLRSSYRRKTTKPAPSKKAHAEQACYRRASLQSMWICWRLVTRSKWPQAEQTWYRRASLQPMWICFR